MTFPNILPQQGFPKMSGLPGTEMLPQILPDGLPRVWPQVLPNRWP